MDFAGALAIARTIEAIRLSSARGRWVALDEIDDA